MQYLGHVVTHFTIFRNNNNKGMEDSTHRTSYNYIAKSNITELAMDSAFSRVAAHILIFISAVRQAN